MPDISKIKLPGSNETYNIKDATAREMISGGVSFEIAWSASDYASSTKPAGAEPRVPYGITVYYNNGAKSVVGQLPADESAKGKFYLIYSNTSAGDHDLYDEYIVVQQGSGEYATYSWEKIGDTQIDLSDVVTDVSLSKSTDIVLGESTTFSNASSSVSFSGGTTDKVLGEDTTFTATDPAITVTPETKYIKATASGGGASWNSKDSKTVVTGYSITSSNKDTFVKSVSAETNKNLVTTTVPNVTGNTSVSIPNVTGNSSVTIPNVTNAGSASTWSFAMGSGNDSETLIISGSNSTAPTLGTSLTATNTTLGTNLTATNTSLGTAITVATGATSTTGTGDAVVTGVTVGDSADAIVSLPNPSTASVIGASSTFTNTQPTVALATETSSATGRVQVATGITSATASGTGVTVGTNDKVTAITSIGTGTAAAQTITVGTNDKVTALTNSTDISVSKGNA